MDKVDKTGWAAVVPYEKCPHVTHAVRHIPRTGLDALAKCETCDDPSENWICLTCYTAACGRYVKSHGVDHYKANPTHCVWLGIQDLSFWCHNCNSYIVHDQLGSVGNAMHMALFEEPAPDFVLQAKRAKPNGPPSPKRGRRRASPPGSAERRSSGGEGTSKSKGKEKKRTASPPLPRAPQSS